MNTTENANVQDATFEYEDLSDKELESVAGGNMQAAAAMLPFLASILQPIMSGIFQSNSNAQSSSRGGSIFDVLGGGLSKVFGWLF